MCKHIYIYNYRTIEPYKIEVQVERLTYLFRLCFTGYFQIFVSPVTFWLKLDFNLLWRLFALLRSKKPTHPTPIICSLFCICSGLLLFLQRHHCSGFLLVIRSKKVSWIGHFSVLNIRALPLHSSLIPWDITSVPGAFDSLFPPPRRALHP